MASLVFILKIFGILKDRLARLGEEVLIVTVTRNYFKRLLYDLET